MLGRRLFVYIHQWISISPAIITFLGKGVRKRNTVKTIQNKSEGAK